jgi:hypothetical protein
MVEDNLFIFSFQLFVLFSADVQTLVLQEPHYGFVCIATLRYIS